MNCGCGQPTRGPGQRDCTDCHARANRKSRRNTKARTAALLSVCRDLVTLDPLANGYPRCPFCRCATHTAACIVNRARAMFDVEQ